ncbi:MAG: GGDEF domain-containing protein, partial [Gammaproteobacteria bacterium]|nr:GGDEF domain-containing protein [Gammaproteobacteria bacterium]
MRFAPSYMTAIEGSKWRILLLGNPLLAVFMALGLWVVVRNGGHQPWEPYLYMVSVSAVILNTVALIARPRSIDVIGYTTVAAVCFIIYGRILSLFIGGIFEQDLERSMFISIFAYIPMVYIAVYVLQDARTGFLVSLFLWLLYVAIIAYFCFPMWQVDSNREGLDHLLLYSFVAHPTALLFMALVPRYSSALESTKEQLEISEQGRQEMELVANTDQLTGLANRRYFDHKISEAWSTALEQRGSLGVLLADIDYFKLFNDSAGHLKGDQCLRRVAQAFKASLPADCYIARFGGEEFVVLVPQPSSQKMGEIASNLRRAIEVMEIPHPGVRGAVVTVSVGGAVMEAKPSVNLRSLLKLADDALYQAKNNGRNCCE